MRTNRTKHHSTKSAQNGIGEKLKSFRLDRERPLTYRALAALIGGIDPTVLWHAERGRHLQDRSLSKIQRFLESVRAA